MSQRWYKKASIQASIIGGVFLLLATITAGIFGLININKVSYFKSDGKSFDKNNNLDTVYVERFYQKSSIKINVSDFRNVGQYVSNKKIGEKYSGHLLDKLIKIKSDVNKGIYPTPLMERVLKGELFEDFEPMDQRAERERSMVMTRKYLSELYAIAPIIMIYGWVEEKDSKNTFAIHIRITYISHTKYQIEPLSSEERIVSFNNLSNDASLYAKYIVEEIIPLAYKMENY